MTIGPEIAEAEPTPIGTMAVGTKVPGGVDLAGPPVRRGHGSGRYRRGRLGRSGLARTQDTRGLVRQSLKRFGLVGVGALGLERLGLGERSQHLQRARGPVEVQNDEKPDKCDQYELREKKMRLHGGTPLQPVLRGDHCTLFRGGANYPQDNCTRPAAVAAASRGMSTQGW